MRGAAAAVATSQLVSVIGLLIVLGKRLNLGSLDGSVLQDSWQYVKPTGLLTLRTLSITATFSVATALCSQTDAAYAAAHQIAFQLWLASSLLADSLAVAAQSLVARSLAAGTAAGRKVARTVGSRVINLSCGLGVALATGLTVGTTVLPLTHAFSSDPGVLSVLSSLMPVVIALQPINALAFTLDGLLYGVNGFSYAAQAMAVSAVPAVGTMLLGAQWVAQHAAGPEAQLTVVWAGLTVVMMGRLLTIFIPFKLQKAPFDKLKDGE